MPILSEIRVVKRKQGILFLTGDTWASIVLVGVTIIIVFLFLNKTPIWVLAILFILILFMIGRRNELFFDTVKGVIIKRTTLFGINIGKETKYNLNVQLLYFDFKILMDAGVGQTYYFRLCLDGEEDALLLFEDKRTIEKIETALLENNIIEKKLPKNNIR